MKLKTLAFLSAILLLTTLSKAQDISIKSETSMTKVAIGDEFYLRYTINETIDTIELTENFKNFDIVRGANKSNSSSTSVIDGKITRKSATKFIYTLKSTQSGTFELPAATAIVNNKKYTSNKAKITVSTDGSTEISEEYNKNDLFTSYFSKLSKDSSNSTQVENKEKKKVKGNDGESLFTQYFSEHPISSSNEIQMEIKGRKKVKRNEAFFIEFNINREANSISITDKIEGFEIFNGPTKSSSNSTQILNGTLTSTTITKFRYIVKAKKLGSYSFPKVNIDVDGKKYESKPYKITVVE